VFELPPRGAVLLVFGGSQGASSLNDEIVEAFGEAGPAVLHSAASATSSGCAAGSARRLPARPVHGRVRRGARRADLVVARAGGSVWELAAAGTPAILVPYPFATADHQTKNARFFERAAARSRSRDRARPRRRPRALADRRPERLRRWARRCSASRSRTPPTRSRRADPACVLRAAALVRRIGGAGSPATRAREGVGRRGRGLGPARTPYLEHVARRAFR
jgi:UDP-N-acetylglucosamine--N-acetylmuramyl-(pentapeptide) pyrophosphoryl-undecaprenol N-acetylglucosamine transferase